MMAAVCGPKISAAEDRFSLTDCAFGRMAEAERGLEAHMCVSADEIISRHSQGLRAIENEFHQALEVAIAGGELGARKMATTSCECVRYVLHEEAGSSPTLFPNSPYPRDCNRHGVLPERQATTGRGMTLADFMECPEAVRASLTLLEVAALRIYTTAAFRSVNDPLRSLQRREAGQAHPVPLTCALIDKAIGKLCASGAQGDYAGASLGLWRGLRGSEITAEFAQRGSTELGVTSATSNLYAALARVHGSSIANGKGTLIHLRTASSSEWGANVSFLSAFPAECEYLYRPLTYLQPIGKVKTTILAGQMIAVVDATAVAN
jgi:hypothetical protein